MTAATAAERAVDTPARGFADRLLAAMPLLTLFAWVCLVYGWQAWLVVTPSIFTDELELTQISRAIAETGVPARRGETYLAGSVVAFLTAPAWLIEDTATAYLVAKLIGAAAMSATVFPVYALARMLASRALALVAAVASVATPAMVYSSFLIEEPFAYFWSALALWLVVRAFVVRTPAAFGLAVAVALVAPLIRTQLAVVPAVLAATALVFGYGSAPMRAWRARWTRADRLGAVVLVVGVAIVLNELISDRSVSWHVATANWKERMLEYGLWAAGALTIGVGVLPLVLGLASVAWARREPGRAARTFGVVLASAVVGFGFYTAVKAAYLSAVFATRVVERNLIYLVPLLFVGLVAWLGRPRPTRVALAASSATALLLLLTTPLVLDFPYFEAPGYAILAAANRNFAMPAEDIRVGLVVVFAVAVAAALAVLAARRGRLAGGLVAGVLGLVLAWNVSGQLQALAGTREGAEQLHRNFVEPADWVDRATGGAPTVFLGQHIDDATGVHLLEFWNRSIRGVWSIDGSAPGPGPVQTPDLAQTNGTLWPDPGAPYILAAGGIEVVGDLVEQRGGWRLYRVESPLRLANAFTGIFNDGWMGETSGYSQFATPDGRAGTIRVVVSREAGGKEQPGAATVRVGTLVIGEDKQPALGDVTAVRRWDFADGAEHVFRIPTPPPPFRVEVEVSQTFVPAEVDARSSDRRALGAQVGYEFVPSR